MAQTETIFYNADYLVIEYLDFIKSPYFVLLQYIQKNEKLRPILRLEEIESFDNRIRKEGIKPQYECEL
mgnify:CR=1 FL=1